MLKGCILNPGHGKIPAPDFNFYIQKDEYPMNQSVVQIAVI